VIGAYLSPDGKRLLTVERAGNLAGEQAPPDLVRLYDTATGKGRTLGEGYAQAAFSADSRRMFVSLTTYTDGRRENSVLKVFDAEGKELASLADATKPGAPAMGTPVLSPDGRRLAVLAGKGRINEPGSIKVFDVATGKEIAEFATGGDFPFMLPAFSADGRLLAAGDYDGQVRVWDVGKRALLRKHRFEGMRVGYWLAFSPGGKTLAVPANVKTDGDRARDPDPLDFPQPRVYLFDPARAGDPEELVCPHGWTGGVAFAPDGKTLAVGGAGAVHLFDVSKPAVPKK
jgi:Tol biopolymer transport system component